MRKQKSIEIQRNPINIYEGITKQKQKQKQRKLTDNDIQIDVLNNVRYPGMVNKVDINEVDE